MSKNDDSVPGVFSSCTIKSQKSLLLLSWRGRAGQDARIRAKDVIVIEGDIAQHGGKRTIAPEAFIPVRNAKIDQRGMRSPVLLVVPVGTTVEFVNSDPAAHNVYWPNIGGDKRLGHNLGTFPQGQSRSFKFDHPGNVPLLCNIHPEMTGTLIVAPTPYFGQTDQILGDYFVAAVPDGTYKLTIWNAGKISPPQTVEVRGNTNKDLP